MRLYVNVDPVALVRNAWAQQTPCPIEMARLAVASGADGIGVHLRKDRRHMRDADVEALIDKLGAPITMKIAASSQLVDLAVRLRPDMCCLVPDQGSEIFIKCGFDLGVLPPLLGVAVNRLNKAGIRVSLLVEANVQQVTAAALLGVGGVILYAGRYTRANPGRERDALLAEIRSAAGTAKARGLTCIVSGGLACDTVADIARTPGVDGISVGHSVIASSMADGLPAAINRFRSAMSMAGSNGIASAV